MSRTLFSVSMISNGHGTEELCLNFERAAELSLDSLYVGNYLIRSCHNCMTNTVIFGAIISVSTPNEHNKNKHKLKVGFVLWHTALYFNYLQNSLHVEVQWQSSKFWCANWKSICIMAYNTVFQLPKCSKLCNFTPSWPMGLKKWETPRPIEKRILFPFFIVLSWKSFLKIGMNRPASMSPFSRTTILNRWWTDLCRIYRRWRKIISLFNIDIKLVLLNIPWEPWCVGLFFCDFDKLSLHFL